MKNRVIFIVLDSFGIGELPDAAEFGDKGAATARHIYEKVGLDVPNLYSLGLSEIEGSGLLKFNGKIIGSYGRASEKSKAKDTVSGHWELMGVVSKFGFSTYPVGFPKGFIREFENRIGIQVIGNIAASGTEIINSLGEEHLKTKAPIVYTSADSVLQIAAHEAVISLSGLYEMCKIARSLTDEMNLNICRIIARPFSGEKNGSFVRTVNRRDFAAVPPEKTYLDILSDAGIKTLGIGKIEDIFSGRGLTATNHTKNNPEGIEATISAMKANQYDFIFTNLVDFDMLFGHRRDALGYKQALEYFDSFLPKLFAEMTENDLLIITADHGCDPTFLGTDHTREYIPVLLYEKNKPSKALGTLCGFDSVGKIAMNKLLPRIS